jgi:hypothetical protein
MPARRARVPIGIAGGIGGLINAALCYSKWPVPVEDTSATFHWHVIPAGFIHGGILALLAVGAADLGRRLNGPLRWAASLLVAWLAGYLSWIPLDISAFDKSLASALAWPLVNADSRLAAVWVPFLYFGAVSGLLYLWLAGQRRGQGRVIEMAAASGAGVLGSLWWWLVWKPWYLSVLHGVVWGSLVGLAISLSRAEE